MYCLSLGIAFYYLVNFGYLYCRSLTIKIVKYVPLVFPVCGYSPAPGLQPLSFDLGYFVEYQVVT